MSTMEKFTWENNWLFYCDYILSDSATTCITTRMLSDIYFCIIHLPSFHKLLIRWDCLDSVFLFLQVLFSTATGFPVTVLALCFVIIAHSRQAYMRLWWCYIFISLTGSRPLVFFYYKSHYGRCTMQQHLLLYSRVAAPIFHLSSNRSASHWPVNVIIMSKSRICYFWCWIYRWTNGNRW